MKVKRMDGKTPNGGDYSEMFFLDKDRKLTNEENAVMCVIRECKKNGELVAETYGICK